MMEIKINRCSDACHQCEAVFAHQDKIHSVAQWNDSKLERQDFCKHCFADREEGDVWCAWASQYVDPKVAEAERQESFSPLRRLFYDLAASEERSSLAQAFLAAQLLKRQRVFRQIRETEEEQEQGTCRVCLYLDRAGNRLIETRDLNFSYTELDNARVLLMEELRQRETPSEENAQEAIAPLETKEESPTEAVTEGTPSGAGPADMQE